MERDVRLAIVLPVEWGLRGNQSSPTSAICYVVIKIPAEEPGAARVAWHAVGCAVECSVTNSSLHLSTSPPLTNNGLHVVNTTEESRRVASTCRQ
jgi:hypothetical protein